MRITITMGFFLPVPPLRGGATEKIWYRFAQEFVAAGHDVTVVSREWPGLPRDETNGRLRHLRLPGWNHTRHLPLNLLLDLWWSARVLRAAPPADILVSNNVSLPIIASARLRRRQRLAVVLGRMPKGQTRFYNRVDRLLATSNAVLNQVRKENPAIVSRGRVMLNPIDAQLHARSNVKPRAGVPLTIGYVGRINPEKGLETLIDAGRLLAAKPSIPPFQLVFVGPHDVLAGGGGEAYRAALAGRAAQAPGAVPVEFTGPIFDAGQLARRYGEIDLFCYPSRAERGEGLSVAPIEAMAAGAVPVVSSLPCYDDLIRPGGNGLVFDHRAADPALALAAALERLLTDDALRRSLSQQAGTDARQFDYSIIAARLLADFAQLVGGSGGKLVTS